jgi:hypothetical protein
MTTSSSSTAICGQRKVNTNGRRRRHENDFDNVQIRCVCVRADVRVCVSTHTFSSKMIPKERKPGKSAQFEEKTYKLSLVRLNPRAMREKEKKIGTSYINMADFVSPDPRSVGCENLYVVLRLHNV